MEQKKNHSHDGHRQRFKQKAIEAGIEHWPYHEVLELILMYAIPRKDVNPLAHDLINEFGSLAGVLDAGYDQLKKIKGVGHEAAAFLSLLPDMFVKYSASKNIDAVVMDKASKTVNYFRTIDRVRNVEEFYVFCLNNKKRLIKTIKFNGNLSSAISVSKTEFAQKIAFESNKSIIILHTHPNGDSQPTDADIVATKRLFEATIAVGLKFEDHIIVANNSYYSFSNSKLLKMLKEEVDPENREGRAEE